MGVCCLNSTRMSAQVNVVPVETSLKGFLYRYPLDDGEADCSGRNQILCSTENELCQ